VAASISSRDSAHRIRVGLAVFFGRDSLWTLYALNSYGDSKMDAR